MILSRLGFLIVSPMFPGKSRLLPTAVFLFGWALFLTCAKASSSMDVVLVVDTSGSMAWGIGGPSDKTLPKRIDRVISALESYAKKLPAGTRLRLISFNSGVKTNKEFKISEENRGELIAAIAKLKGEVGSGDTWLWEAMREGIKAAETYAAADPDLTTTLYVLSDGEYDNKDPGREKDISLAKVLGESKSLGGESLYGSLVLLGKPKSKGGAFSDEYLELLKNQAGPKCEVQLDEDFNPLFPPFFTVRPDKIEPKEKVSVMEGSEAVFARVEWRLNDKPVAGTKRLLEFTPEKFGRYEVTFRGFDEKERRARARVVINVGQEQVKAVPKISIDGKPFESVDTIIQGQRIDLSHESTGPVAKTVWTVDGNQTEAAKLNSVLNRVGRYNISLTVESAPGPTGEVTRSTSEAIVFEVVAPRLMAQPEVTVNGKPLAEAGTIHPGDRLRLISKNISFVKTFEWKVGSDPLSGQTTEWEVPSSGTYEIVHTVVGDSENRDTAAPISITAVDPELVAIPEVLYKGKPFSQSSNIYVGETLQLVSKSSGPVKNATWTVNGEQIVGEKVPWPISQPGQIEIKLRVEGQNPALVNESDVVKVFAKKRPPVWALWAAGIVEIFLLGLAWRLFTGNRPRACRLESRLDPKSTNRLSRVEVSDYWNRLTKEARIPMADAVALSKGKRAATGPTREVFEFWAKEGTKHPTRYFTVKKAPNRRAPAGLGCPFDNYGGIELKPDPSADKNNPRFVFRYPDAPPSTKQVYLNFVETGSTTGDKIALVASMAAALALFFLFVVKVYPLLS